MSHLTNCFNSVLIVVNLNTSLICFPYQKKGSFIQCFTIIFSHLIPVHPSVLGTLSTNLPPTGAVIQAQIVFTAPLNGPLKRQPHRRKQGRTTCSSARSQTNSRKTPAVSSWSATLPAQISLSQHPSWLFFSN